MKIKEPQVQQVSASQQKQHTNDAHRDTKKDVLAGTNIPIRGFQNTDM